MKRTFLTLAFLAATLPGTTGVAITIDFTGKMNEFSFTNYEMVLRQDDSTTDTDALTLGGKNYEIIDQTELLAVGDLFIQIYNSNSLKIDGTTVVGLGAPGVVTEFTAYAIQRISGFTVNSANDVDIAFGAAPVDPFGVFTPGQLAAGQVLTLWMDDIGGVGVDFTHQSSSGGSHSANIMLDVASATDGIHWGTFGTADPVDGQPGITVPGVFASNVDPAAVSSSNTQTAFGDAVAGLNIMVRGGPLTGISFMGVTAPTLAGGGVHSLVAQSELFVNDIPGVDSPADYINLPGATLATSNWNYQSDDPFAFVAVPEPNSFSLLILSGLIGIGTFANRRKNRV